MSRILGLLLVCACMVAAAPLGAHHSTAMYTGSRTITGKVVKFEWTNPHAHVYIETKDEKGATVVWDCELMSLNHLRSYGWMRTTVKSGDVISATGGAAKSGAPSMISAVIELPDGRKIRS